MASEQPSQRRFWLIAFLAFPVTAGVLHWQGLPLVLVPETSALIAFVAAGLIHRMLFGKPSP